MWIREMPSLASLNHVDVIHGVEKPTLRTGRCCCLFPILTPDVCLTNIMIIRNRNHRTILQDLTKLNTEFKPAVSMLSVIVGLVARKEE